MKRKMMDKLIFAVSAALILTLCNLAYAVVVRTSSDTEIPVETIIVDVGHGGFDGGAVAQNGVPEKDINLQIGLKLAGLLREAGYNVITTRDSDMALCENEEESIRQKKLSDMENRMKILKNNPDAVLISVHQNKFSDKSVKGAQVFYNRNKPQSAVLAECIQKSIKENADRENNRAEKSSGEEYYLLEYSPNEGVIVECGFISNEEELAKLMSEKYQNKLAKGIMEGINRYFDR